MKKKKEKITFLRPLPQGLNIPCITPHPLTLGESSELNPMNFGS